MREDRDKISEKLSNKVILVLCLPEKSSFTPSKLRFFGLRKPKNPSCYTTSTKMRLPDRLVGQPHHFFILYANSLLLYLEILALDVELEILDTAWCALLHAWEVLDGRDGVLSTQVDHHRVRIRRALLGLPIC